MKVTGTILNDEQRLKVLQPFAKSNSKAWSLKKIAKAVSIGSVELKKNKQQVKAIKASLSTL